MLNSNEESEVECSINVQGPNNIQSERLVEALNVNNEETADSNARREIRDRSLRLNINILENFDKFQDFSVNTPSYADQMENVGSLPMNSNLVNLDESQDLRVILVHSSDTLYTLFKRVNP